MIVINFPLKELPNTIPRKESYSVDMTPLHQADCQDSEDDKPKSDSDQTSPSHQDPNLDPSLTSSLLVTLLDEDNDAPWVMVSQLQSYMFKVTYSSN